MTLRRMRIESCEGKSVTAFISIDSVHDFLLEDVQFLNNTNTGGSSCISGTNSAVTFHNITVEGNSGHEGGFLKIRNSTIFVKNSRFRDNSAMDSSGGAMHLDDCDTSVIDSIFEGNKAVRGGAVFIEVRRTQFLGLMLVSK